MSAKIGPELARRLKEVGAAASQEELPVIVTVNKDTDLEALKKQGLKVEQTIESINVVSGTLPAAAVKAIVKLDDVKEIDYDGEVQAIKKDDDEK